MVPNPAAPGVTRAVHVTSTLAAPREAVWARVSTMAGVNAELMPLVRMSYPPQAAVLDAAAVPLGRTAFRSVLLLFGVLPIDRHDLCLLRVDPPAGFHESSTSLLQRRWVHVRTLEAVPGGCRLTDEVDFEPRLPAIAALLRPLVRAIFAHRHRRLRRHFGEAAGTRVSGEPRAP
jgi:ligand-binding SRPBCC domain-containing protein